MTKEQAEKWWPLLEALRDGKTIQYKYINKYGGEEWIDIDNPNWSSGIEYRVKPGKRVVPFENSAEFLEALASQDSQFLVNKTLGGKVWPLEVNDSGLHIFVGAIGYRELLDLYEFEDGTPCGKEVME